jgi:hypothetical protein
VVDLTSILRFCIYLVIGGVGLYVDRFDGFGVCIWGEYGLIWGCFASNIVFVG